jgi:cytochrome P450/NADPH-cytochrome P450 reductase
MLAMNAPTVAIPTPPRRPLVGNLLQVPRERFVQYATAQAPRFDGVFALDLAGPRAIFAYAPDVVAELCDEARFRKVVVPPLSYIRAAAGDGLFTAHSDEPNWAKAHRVLMPAFSLRSMRTYFPAMLEIAQELVTSWEGRQGEDLEVTDDMTRLTLDTIALTGFGQRFRSFRQPELHPFLAAMGRALEEAQARITRLPKTRRLYAKQQRQFDADVAAMHAVVDDVIAARRASGETVGDLLDLMLAAVDPQTGERLDDVNVRYQILTFLIAGHETTSGLLSFALYQLLRNPQALAQAYAEVDRFFPGDTEPTYRAVTQLDVIPRILDETLRLWSPAPGFTVAPYERTVIGGRFELRRDRPINVLIPALHRDPVAWPEPERFDIDRFLAEHSAGRHPHAYKPFGNGVRACIGRQFALIEAGLALAMVLRRFALEDPYDYRLDVKQSLTIKPAGFRIRVRTRRPHERLTAAPAAATGRAPAAAESAVDTSVLAGAGTGLALSVLYGSTMGTCADIAGRVAERGEAAGFATSLRSLDEALDDLPTSGLAVVVTPTYNGEAPDNARRFDAAIAAGRFAGPELAGRLADVQFALLGCGNTQWVSYQAFPKRVEQALLEAGASPLIPRAEADAAGDFDGALERWASALVDAVATRSGQESFAAESQEPRYGLELLDERAVRPAVVPEHAYPLRVVANDELLGDPAGLWDFTVEAPLISTRHVVLELPEGKAYQVGDHLAVFARNDPDLVARAAERFGLSPAQILLLRQRRGRPSHLPVGTPIDVAHLLGEFVELQDVATRADLRLLLEHTGHAHTTAQLTALTADTGEGERAYREQVLDRHVSLLDVLERFPTVELPFQVFLERCGPIRPRYYSISSSPLADPRRMSLTVGVLHGPAWSGTGQYKGLTSNYIARVAPGDEVFGFVRTPNPPFRPPADPATPVVLIGPGTGVAPLRGFLQERAVRQQRGEPVGRALLFSGCRHPDHDWYYREELQAWAEAGLVEPHTAFSALPDTPHRFVQHAIAAAGDELWTVLSEQGAAVYLCGDGVRMAPAVRRALLELHTEHTGGSEADGLAWLAALQRSGRYAEDVFAPSR